MKEIEIKGYKVLVDDEDYPTLNRIKWHLNSSGYACRVIRRPLNPSGQGCLLMHRFIMCAKSGQQVEHKDRNKLNNTRANLRFSTQSQNGANRLKSSASRPYKGVFKYKDIWGSEIVFKKKDLWLGTYGNPEDAARAYNLAAKKYFGEYALLNDVPNPLSFPHRFARGIGGSVYRGVSIPSGLSKKWKATIFHGKKNIHLGYFSNPKDAALAYDAKALELFGPFARLNFPLSGLRLAAGGAHPFWCQP